MRILHVISQLTKGGAERVAVELANAFSRSGDEVTILASKPTRPEFLQNAIDPAVDLRFVSPDAGAGSVVYLAALKWLMTNRDFVRSRDIVHCHLTFGSVFGSMVVLQRAIRGAARPKVLETYHAVGMAVSGPKRWFHMLLAASHDGLVPMASDPVIEAFKRSHPKLPCALIPNGISSESERPSQQESAEYRRSLGIPDGVPVVGTIGRLVPDRSPERIVEIFAHIARERRNVRFFMGGEGSQAERVKVIAARFGLADRLILPGLILRPSLPLSFLDLYVTLNVGPITGVAAMEAAASGVPVIALQLEANYTSSPTDWIFSSGSTAAVASEALRLLDNPMESQELAARQKEHVRRSHGIQPMVDAYRDFYQALLK